MDRQKAIDAICSVWIQHSTDRCVGQQEYDNSERELFEALRAIGVSREEVPAHLLERVEVFPVTN